MTFTSSDGAPEAAQPYRLGGLCASLGLILALTVVLGALAAGMALLVDMAASGAAHPLALYRQWARDGRLAFDQDAVKTFSLAFSMVLYVALSLAVLILARWRGGTAWRDLIAWHRWALWRTPRAFWWIAGATFVYSFAANLALAYYYPPSQEWVSMPNGVLAEVMLGILAVLLAPLAEELVFRGWVFTSLKAQFGFAAALVATSLVFALAHWERTHLYALAVFPVGLALGAVRHTCGSLKASMTFHAIYNGIAFAVTFAGG